MDKINKILYLVLVFFLGFLGIHKFLNGRIKEGVIQFILSLLWFIGGFIALIEFICDIFMCHSDENGQIEIPHRFFDFLG